MKIAMLDPSPASSLARTIKTESYKGRFAEGQNKHLFFITDAGWPVDLNTGTLWKSESLHITRLVDVEAIVVSTSKDQTSPSEAVAGRPC